MLEVFCKGLNLKFKSSIRSSQTGLRPGCSWEVSFPIMDTSLKAYTILKSIEYTESNQSETNPLYTITIRCMAMSGRW